MKRRRTLQRLTMLVTSDAQWVLPDTPEFFEALGDPDPDYDSIAFAVKNLGFIRYQVLERSIVEVELHPRNVELPADLQQSFGGRAAQRRPADGDKKAVVGQHSRGDLYRTLQTVWRPESFHQPDETGGRHQSGFRCSSAR